MTSPITAYDRVITYVTSKIGKREWPPGYKLPSQIVLATTLGVGETTVVNALRSLQEKGIIVGRAGSGRYVAGGEDSPDRVINGNR
jgi:GntR family transcriptional regulator